jgi:hypothetical protein
MSVIEIAKEFSTTPGGRFRIMGPDSGEEFRDRLKRELDKTPAETVTVILDGVEGYGSSFLEEAFGGLIRNRLVPAAEALRRVRVIAKDRYYTTYADEARGYMEAAAARLNG